MIIEVLITRNKEVKSDLLAGYHELVNYYRTFYFIYLIILTLSNFLNDLTRIRKYSRFFNIITELTNNSILNCPQKNFVS